MSQTIKKYSQIIRAINYNRGLQDFTIVGMCCLKDLFAVSSSLETHCDGVQVAVCGIEPIGTVTNLGIHYQVASTIVICRILKYTRF